MSASIKKVALPVLAAAVIGLGTWVWNVRADIAVLKDARHNVEQRLESIDASLKKLVELHMKP